MIRRDYILRMIEEAAQALARIISFKNGRRWREAAEVIDQQFARLVGLDAQAVSRLSETELLARVIEGEPTQAVREKTLILTALLKEAGDLAAVQDQAQEGLACYLKALHLLLDVLGRGEPFECPEFVPRVEALTAALSDEPLPVGTHALLMQHYERIGQFAKEEDALFAILEADSGHEPALDLGISFYHRLQGQSDDALAAGDLPRNEVEAGLAELERRKAALAQNRPPEIGS
jgi:hypothetical protein